MPKRMRDNDDPQVHRRERAFADGNPPSPAQRMPGGWWDDELEYTPTLNCWETIKELASTVSLANIIGFTWHHASRFLRRQRIVAHPVESQDGYSNKKRLIDAGVVDPAESHKTNHVARPRSKFTRGLLISYEREALSQYPTPNFMPGSWPNNQQAFATRVYEDVAEIKCTNSPPGQPASDAVDHTFDLDSPAFTSTPRGGLRSALTLQKPSSPRKLLSPLSKKLPQKTASAGPQQPYTDKRIAKIIGSSPPNGYHTRINRNPTQVATPQSSASQSPYTRIFRKTTAYLLAVDQVTKDAHDANIQHKATRDARVDRIAEPLSNDETQEVDKEVDNSFVYHNDLSELPDAPPAPEKKAVTWQQRNRTKPFVRGSKVGDMLDSFLEDMKTCDSPEKARAQREALEQQRAKNLPHLSAVRDDTFDLPQGPAHEVMDEVTDEPMLSNAYLHNIWKQKEHELLLAKPQPAEPVQPVSASVKKPLVTDLTESELKGLEDAAKRSNNGLVSDYKYVRGIEAHDLGTLLPKLFNGAASAWLNDNIINEYLGLLVDHCRQAAGWSRQTKAPAPVHAFASQWYANFKKSYANVEKWPRRWNLTGKNLLGAEIILIPICENSHWTLLVIRPKDRIVEYFDSLGGSGYKYTDTALAWLAAELGPDFVADEWRVGGEQKSQRQANGSDCGVFTLLNALVVLRGDEHDRVIVDNGMGAARRRIAVSLLGKKPTGEMEA